MKKTIITASLLIASTQVISSNSCLIDGRTVFQKAPCPIHEKGVNLTGEIRQHRLRKQTEQREIAAHDKAVAAENKKQLKIARDEYRNSPEGKAERRARVIRNIAIDNAATLRSIDHNMRYGH